MPNIISNTSCLIVLDNIGMLDVLKELYGKVFITEEVSKGVLIKARKRNIITSTQEVLNKLRNEGFRISDEIEKEFLKYDM